MLQTTYNDIRNYCSFHIDILLLMKKMVPILKLDCRIVFSNQNSGTS